MPLNAILEVFAFEHFKLNVFAFAFKYLRKGFLNFKYFTNVQLILPLGTKVLWTTFKT